MSDTEYLGYFILLCLCIDVALKIMVHVMVAILLSYMGVPLRSWRMVLAMCCTFPCTLFLIPFVAGFGPYAIGWSIFGLFTLVVAWKAMGE